jgi:hypothetical protein
MGNHVGDLPAQDMVRYLQREVAADVRVGHARDLAGHRQATGDRGIGHPANVRELAYLSFCQWNNRSFAMVLWLYGAMAGRDYRPPQSSWTAINLRLNLR